MIYCKLGGIWRNLSATCGWIRRIYLAFLEFIEKKWKIGLKNGYGSLGSDPFGGWTLRFYPVFCQMHWKKKWKFGVKIAYGNFGYYSFAAWMLRIYLFFPTFTDQMENWGECGLWEFRVLATCGPNSQNSPSFSRIH